MTVKPKTSSKKLICKQFSQGLNCHSYGGLKTKVLMGSENLGLQNLLPGIP